MSNVLTLKNNSESQEVVWQHMNGFPPYSVTAAEVHTGCVLGLVSSYHDQRTIDQYCDNIVCGYHDFLVKS